MLCLLSGLALGEEAAVPTSGACGENLIWTFDDGVLTIICNTMHTVIVEKGVTMLLFPIAFS